ncbi:MAG: ATP-binding protein [Gammaproteobacteria bacterium]
MSREATGSARQLQDAFLAFNQMSVQLESSYRELEQRVAELNAELAAARSERLRQLAEKERLANRLELLLEALPGGVVVLDGDGKVREANPAARDLLGEPLIAQGWDTVTRRAFAPRSDDTHEVTLRDERRITISRRPLGCEPGHILLLHDVTETRALQEAVSRQQRLSAMGQTTAALAHQIRTPLSAALLYAAHLGRADLQCTDRERFSAKLLARLRQLDHMVNDMLQFARGGSADSELVLLPELLNDFTAAIEPHLQSVGGACTINNLVGDGRLYGNRQALSGALLNLATNALQACESRPELSLTVRDANDATLAFELQDNGPGIPEELLPRIFEPFFTTRPDGTGLGLAVVQTVVHAHHGAIEVRSHAGVGTTFLLSLPAAAHNDALPSGAGAAGPLGNLYQAS